MYTYKCEKCGEEFEVNERIIPEGYKEYIIHKDCGGKLYRVYKSTYVVIKGVR